MSNTKHTPGNWVAKKDDEMWSIQTDIRRKDNDNTIAGIWNNTEEAEADARLIAAAPDLLEGLQNLLWNFEGKEGLSSVQKAAIKYANEAIYKAPQA